MRFLSGLFVAIALVSPAIAQPISDPRALIEKLYAGYMPPNEFPPDPAPLQSARLNGLIQKDRDEANGEIGRIDFDAYVNGQDYGLTELSIADPYFAGGKAVVQVSFRNFDNPQNLGFLLVNEDGGWKIDDVWAQDVEFGYDLLDILQSPMP